MRVNCPYCSVDHSLTPGQSETRPLTRIGKYYRSSDCRWIQRFRCPRCKRSCSRATFHPCYRQNKRQLNYKLRKALSSGNTQRRIALLFRINRKTVARKLKFLARRAEIALSERNLKSDKIVEMQFDDVITFEHTKCKPLSIIMAIGAPERFILGLDVASMPANGKLAAISLKKYGKRKDERTKVRRELFQSLGSVVANGALIKSDESPHYPKDVATYFPSCRHRQVKGRKGCITGQGELKKIGFDPIFTLNHSAAMLRANISRLFRRTWNTTKNASALRDHLLVYAHFHNEFLLKHPTTAVKYKL
jgi:transposase-like protein